MVVFKSLRQSPAYLYTKAYCLCALVSLFKSTPVTSGISTVKSNLKHEKSRILETHKKRRNGDAHSGPRATQQTEAAQASYVQRIATRWYQRTVDLVQIKLLLRRDDGDLKAYPEVEWDASVRSSSSLHPEEARFIGLRKKRMSSEGQNSLHRFLGLPPDEIVDPRDVPLVALGGSGGGYRAMYGFTAFISAAKRLHLWDCITWAAGVSGSCWTLGAYYTIAGQNTRRLTQHYLSMAGELAHPMSLHAINTVARTSKGVYFLIGPLVRKAQSSTIGLGIMDLYATLITTYQLLSRVPGNLRLSRATFQFSRVWRRACAEAGAEPMPILTAVRRAPKNSLGVKPHRDSSASKGQPPERSLTQHDTTYLTPHPPKSSTIQHKPDSARPPSDLFQWFEVSPLEVGCASVNRYIPTWSWGRTFVSGHSVNRKPEQSLSLLLGQCTSAPAGPLTGYISALLATIPKGTVMSRMLFALNNFVRMKKWERSWANPIRAGHDPNPFYGLGLLPRLKGQAAQRGSPDEKAPNTDGHKASFQEPAAEFDPGSWEAQGRVRLMDGGMSNNLPNHILARPERQADILISFDASSDIHTSSALQRIQNFADDCGIELSDRTTEFDPPAARHGNTTEDEACSTATKVEARYIHHYARIFQGKRRTGEEIYLIYCPLLPNPVNPTYNPSVRRSRGSTCGWFVADHHQDSYIQYLLQPYLDPRPGQYSI